MEFGRFFEKSQARPGHPEGKNRFLQGRQACEWDSLSQSRRAGIVLSVFVCHASHRESGASMLVSGRAGMPPAAVRRRPTGWLNC